MSLRHLSFCLIVVLMAVFSFAQAPNLQEPDKEAVVLDTSMGKIVIELLPNAAPKHVKNFKQLVKSGFYNGTKFHRVIPGFMIQGGDPNTKDADRSNDGTGNSGTKVPAEFNAISHKRGIVSMARSQDPNSASCQFFIVVKDSTFLDQQYSVFGRVIQGMDIADKIVNVKRDARDNPTTAVTITKVTIEPRPAAK